MQFFSSDKRLQELFFKVTPLPTYLAASLTRVKGEVKTDTILDFIPLTGFKSAVNPIFRLVQVAIIVQLCKISKASSTISC